MQDIRPIFLIGMPGCGKTTLGRALARMTDRRFIDLDIYIEGRYSRSVSDIFAQMGEDKFRQIERSMLHEVAEMEDVVVACGGGAPCYFDNMEYIDSRGTTILLRASRARLIERLWRARSRRPAVARLSRGELEQYVDRTLLARAPWYDRARLQIDASELESKDSIAITARRCINMLQQL